MEGDCLLAFEEVEGRNRLSRICDAETFNDILACLPRYAALFECVSAQLSKDV